VRFVQSQFGCTTPEITRIKKKEERGKREVRKYYAVEREEGRAGKREEGRGKREERAKQEADVDCRWRQVLTQ
jgi:hypothetical protein